MAAPFSIGGPIALVAAISGFLCVAIGAFGAHALSDPRAKELVEIGVRYQMLHTGAAFAILLLRAGGASGADFAAPFFLIGGLLFCGSLYAMALGAPRWFGAITPLGGVSFLIGWGVLAWASLPLLSRSH